MSNNVMSTSFNSSYHLMDGYYVSELVFKFDNITHYGTNFKSIKTPIIELDTDDWFDSFAMFAVMVAMVAAVFLLALFGFCCYAFRRRPGGKVRIDNDKQINKCRFNLYWNIFAIIVAVIGAASFSSGFYAETRLHKSIEDLGQPINFLHTNFGEIMQHLDIIFTEMSNVRKQLDSIGTSINQAKTLVEPLDDSQPIKQGVNQLVENYAPISQQIEQSAEVVRLNITTRFVPDLDLVLEIVDRAIDSYHFLIRLTVCVVLVLFVLVALLFMAGVWRNRYRLWISILAFVFLMLLILAVAVLFILLVGGSDFCVQAIAFVHRFLDTVYLDFLVGNTILQSLIGAVKLTVLMFNPQIATTIAVYCGPSAVRGVSDEVCASLIHAQDLLLESFPNQTNKLDHRFDLMTSAAEINSKLLGDILISAELYDTITIVCTTVYETIFYFFISVCIAFPCFYILILLSIWLYFNATATPADDKLYF